MTIQEMEMFGRIETRMHRLARQNPNPDRLKKGTLNTTPTEITVEKNAKGSFPPPPQLLPKPGDNLLQKKPVEEPKIKILTKQNAQEGNLQQLWQALSTGNEGNSEKVKEPVIVTSSTKTDSGMVDISSSSSMTSLEVDLKSLLKISGKRESEGAKQPKFVIGAANLGPETNPSASGNYCGILMTQLTASGQNQPRYDFITDPGTGLVAAQVTLDDGTMFHSPHPCEGREKASESAAKVALESLGLIQGRGVNVKQQGGRRGRGRGHRGRGHQGHQQNQYQPWAEYSGHYAGLKNRSNNMELAGTDQMDIRYREKQADPKLPANDPLMQQIQQQKQNVTTPAFVPLQVSRKAVKSVKEKDNTPPVEEAKFVIGGNGVTDKVETVKDEVKMETTPRPSVSKESTPQRSLGRGHRGNKRGRQGRMAANFGAE